MMRKIQALAMLFLLLFFALPLMAQDVEITEAPDAAVTEIPDIPDIVVEVEVPSEQAWYIDLLNTLGQGMNTFAGGFLAASGVFVLFTKFAGNTQFIALLEKQFDNATKSYPPETKELLGVRLGKLGEAIESVGKVVQEVTDGVPIESKTQAAAPSREVG
jgi:hypothetical protein